MTGIEERLGELTASVRAQNESLERVVDLIPVVATHEQRHDDFDENWKPLIKDHEKRINWVVGAFKVLGAIGTSLGVIAGIYFGIK